MALGFDPNRTFVRGINKYKHKHIGLLTEEEEKNFQFGKIFNFIPDLSTKLFV